MDGWDPWDQEPEIVTVEFNVGLVTPDSIPVVFTGTRVECAEAKRIAYLEIFEMQRKPMWDAATARYEASGAGRVRS